MTWRKQSTFDGVAPPAPPDLSPTELIAEARKIRPDSPKDAGPYPPSEFLHRLADALEVALAALDWEYGN